MKKLGFWIVGGLGVATVCGLAGLPHLSATVFTLTVFCATPHDTLSCPHLVVRCRLVSA